jgi:ATP-dependent helicase/nuclease subunit A
MHPLVRQVNPSDEQLPAVTARGADLVLTAGAGTGKTRTLVARYLALLAEGVPVRRLVAITFTQKAAREMRNRVRDELRRYLARDDLAAEEAAFWRDRYVALDGARISTIHSLCSEILRSHPERLDLDPGYDVLAEGAMALLQRRAVQEALAWAADDPDAARAYGLLGERTLAMAVEALLKGRLTADEVLRELPVDDLLGHWRRIMADASYAAWETLRTDPAWREAVEAITHATPLDDSDLLAIQLAGLRAALAEAEAMDAATWDPACLAPVAAIKLTGGAGGKWPGGKAEVGAIKNALSTLRDLWKVHGPTVLLAPNAADEELAQAMPPTIACYRRASEGYRQAKSAQHALDYDDLEQGALTLLADPEVRAAWQRRVDAVLVDEFQDTNQRQRDIVRHLCAAPGQLFVVGDAKQSIYRFRGADVVVFREERHRIDREGLARSLATSYRAHPRLLAALNAMLAPILGADEDPARPWVEPFEPLTAVERPPRLPDLPAYVELHLAVGTKGDGALDRAADAVAQRLIALVEGDDGDIGYGDVAILCRASSAFESYENALERAGVPFLTVAGKGFYQRPEVRSLLVMLRAAADLDDDVALVGSLRAPVFGLSDLALYRLARARPHGRYASWWDYLHSDDAPRLKREQARLERALARIEGWHRLAGRAHVADLLQRILLDTHYQAALMAAGQRRAARNVAKLLADARASELVGVGEFLEYVDSLRDVGAREGEARPTSEGAVQLMTVHAAKGLEFPVVVLGDLAYQGRGPGGLLLDDRLGPVCKLASHDAEPAAYTLAKAREKDQIDAEDRRLLYVAATRAEELLILSGTASVRKDGLPWLNGWLGQLGADACLGLASQDISAAAEADVTALLLRVDEEPATCALYGGAWEPQGVSSLSPEASREDTPDERLLQPIAALAGDVDEATRAREIDPPLTVWRVAPPRPGFRAPAWLVGNLVHEALAEQRAIAWRAVDGASFSEWARARAASQGLTDPPRQRDAARRAAELVQRFRAHPLCGELQRAERVLYELPYARPQEQVSEQGTLDILYRDGNGWHVLDTKTDRFRDMDEARAAVVERGYVAQVRRYGRAVEALVGERPTLRLVLLDCAGAVMVLDVDDEPA